MMKHPRRLVLRFPSPFVFFVLSRVVTDGLRTYSMFLGIRVLCCASGAALQSSTTNDTAMTVFLSLQLNCNTSGVSLSNSSIRVQSCVHTLAPLNCRFCQYRVPKTTISLCWLGRIIVLNCSCASTIADGIRAIAIIPRRFGGGRDARRQTGRTHESEC